MRSEFEQGLRALQQMGLGGAHADERLRQAERRAAAEEEERARASAEAAARARARREAESRRAASAAAEEEEEVEDLPRAPARARPAAPPKQPEAAPVLAASAPPAPTEPAARPPPLSSAAAAGARAAGAAAGSPKGSPSTAGGGAQPAAPKRAPVSYEAAAQIAERVAQSHSASSPTAPIAAAAARPPPGARPRTCTEFERQWRAAWPAKGRTDAHVDAAAALLELLPPAELAPFFGAGMSDEIFEGLLGHAAARHARARADDSASALALLCGLARVRRHDVLWMFAGDAAKAAARALISAGGQPAAPFTDADVQRARSVFT